jgi:N-methylhydantoinase A
MAKPIEHRRLHLDSGSMDAAVFDRATLGAGVEIAGPAIVVQLDSTTLMLPGQVARVHTSGSLIVRETNT